MPQRRHTFCTPCAYFVSACLPFFAHKHNKLQNRDCMTRGYQAQQWQSWAIRNHMHFIVGKPWLPYLYYKTMHFGMLLKMCYHIALWDSGSHLTSNIKSPARNPALSATLPFSTLSRYCRAGIFSDGTNCTFNLRNCSAVSKRRSPCENREKTAGQGGYRCRKNIFIGI